MAQPLRRQVFLSVSILTVLVYLAIGYGAFRFAVEFTREPDSFLGLLALGLSMGQWLSLPMVIGGVAMLVWAHRRPPDATKRDAGPG